MGRLSTLGHRVAAGARPGNGAVRWYRAGQPRSWGGGGSLHAAAAPLQLLGGHIQVEPSVGDIDDDGPPPPTSASDPPPDGEVELGVVIGKRCRYLSSPQEGLDSIAGYMVCHDVSEREFQLGRGGQWVKGKSCETFSPAGPWLVTPDEIANPGALDLWLDVNGERRHTGSTADMIFDVGYLIHYLSQFLELEPGDIINTGTPSGVPLGMAHPVYLKPGDVVELGITGLGRQRQMFAAAP